MATGLKIIFGNVVFLDADIRAASLIEEYSPTGITLPSNSFEVTLYSENADFSILNPAGDYASLINRAPMMVYEIVDTNEVFLGKFYLDKWENEGENLIKFTCIDEIGALDDLTYMGNIWVHENNIGALVYIILGGIGIPYEIDPEVAAIPYRGWIPKCTYREALQQIAFSAGCYFMTARQEGFIKIGLQSDAVVTTGIRCGVSAANQSRNWGKRWRQSQWELIRPLFPITNDIQGESPKISLKPQVTGVKVTSHTYTFGKETKEIINSVMAAGIHTIVFSKPMHSLVITNGEIVESGSNYAMINSFGTGTVLLTGIEFIDTQKIHEVYGTALPPGAKENVLKIENATLVSIYDGEATAQRVLDYYQNRHLIDVKLFQPAMQITDYALVDTLYSKKIRGIIEKMDTDLTGGFISSAQIVGFVDPEI